MCESKLYSWENAETLATQNKGSQVRHLEFCIVSTPVVCLGFTGCTGGSGGGVAEKGHVGSILDSDFGFSIH